MGGPLPAEGDIKKASAMLEAMKIMNKLATAKIAPKTPGRAVGFERRLIRLRGKPSPALGSGHAGCRPRFRFPDDGHHAQT